MKRRYFTVETEVHIDQTVDVDVDVKITDKEIIEALKESGELEEVLASAGFIKAGNFGDNSTILDTMKAELISEILEKATLEQLEQFRKTL